MLLTNLQISSYLISRKATSLRPRIGFTLTNEWRLLSQKWKELRARVERLGNRTCSNDFVGACSCRPLFWNSFNCYSLLFQRCWPYGPHHRTSVSSTLKTRILPAVEVASKENASNGKSGTQTETFSAQIIHTEETWSTRKSLCIHWCT